MRALWLTLLSRVTTADATIIFEKRREEGSNKRTKVVLAYPGDLLWIQMSGHTSSTTFLTPDDQRVSTANCYLQETGGKTAKDWLQWWSNNIHLALFGNVRTFEKKSDIIIMYRRESVDSINRNPHTSGLNPTRFSAIRFPFCLFVVYYYCINERPTRQRTSDRLKNDFITRNTCL